jgi:hypothetical protein
MQPFEFLLSMRLAIRSIVVAGAVATVASGADTLPKTEKAPGIGGLAAASVTRIKSADAPAGKSWLYQVALPFQVSPDKGAVFANLREAEAQGVDFEAGNDVIVFSRLEEISSALPVAANRNHTEPNPNASPAGSPAVMVKYPIRGGFVPLGAKRADGTPHPHAGSGFGFSLAQAWKPLADGPPPYLQNSYAGAEAFGYWELQQYAFDGERFLVTHTDRVPFSELVGDWQIYNGGMTNAIADGDDLLLPMVGKSKFDAEGRRFNGSVVVRMSRHADRWKAVACDPIEPLGQTIEPSLVRDVDGRLLASARGSGERRLDIRIVRSADAGRTWSNLIEVGNAVGAGPVTLNSAVDGTPYVAACRLANTPGPNDPLAIAARQRNRAVETNKNSRNTLVVIPLAASRDKLAAEIEVLDCRAKFGPPQGSNWSWRADHPSGMTVRLADGKWHHLLGFRVQDYREIKEAMPPTPHTGMYLREILSNGPERPLWNF